MTQRYLFHLILVTSLVGLLTTSSWASDAFTGFQMDNQGQYFGFMGARTPLVTGSPDLEPFIQMFVASMGYSYRLDGRLIDARQHWVVPSVGLKQRLGNWNVLGFVGAQLRRREDEQLMIGGGTTRADQAGVYLQTEAFYWHPQGTFHAIASYSDLDRFYWGRVRGKRLAYQPQGCCATFVGYEVASMGNRDFYAVQTGPVVEWPVGLYFWTLRGGYQYMSTFRTGVYGGIELYFPF